MTPLRYRLTLAIASACYDMLYAASEAYDPWRAQGGERVLWLDEFWDLGRRPYEALR